MYTYIDTFTKTSLSMKIYLLEYSTILKIKSIGKDNLEQTMISM